MVEGFSADRSGRRRGAADRAVWPGAAFVVEALILLVFLAACLAVFMQLFGDANETGRQNVRLERAVEAASNRAERFAADPLAGMEDSAGAGRLESTVGEGDDALTVTCDVTPEGLPAGVLYRAEIGVWDGDELVYDLTTARYVAGASAGAGDAGAAAAADDASAAGAQGGGANG